MQRDAFKKSVNLLKVDVFFFSSLHKKKKKSCKTARKQHLKKETRRRKKKKKKTLMQPNALLEFDVSALATSPRVAGKNEPVRDHRRRDIADL